MKTYTITKTGDKFIATNKDGKFIADFTNVESAKSFLMCNDRSERPGYEKPEIILA